MSPVCCKPLKAPLRTSGLSRVGPSRPQRRSTELRKGKVWATAGAPIQVPAEYKERQTEGQSILGKIGRMLVLAPALTLAVVGCNRATAAQAPHLPSPEVSRIKLRAGKAAAASYASAVISNPKVHASMIVSLVGAVGVLAIKASQKRWSKSTPALARPTNTQAEGSFKSRQSVPEPGILFLGLAGVMMDSMKSSKKRTSRLNAGSVGSEALTGDEEGFTLERGSVLSLPGEKEKSAKKIPKRKATSDEQRFDPLGDAFSFGRRPLQFLSNKFDILESVLNGGWQEEIKTLENLPEWDPVSAVHKAAGEPTRFQKSKYDPTESFLSGPSSQIPAWDPVIGILRALNGADATAKAKYDPAAAALEGLHQLNESDFNVAPKWDPIFGLQNAANDPLPPKSSRYDMADSLFHGSWQKKGGEVELFPKWDPVSGLVNIARSQSLELDSKFDVMSALLSGDWLSGKSSLKDIPSWDPAGKLVEISKKEDDPIGSSKYDAAASLFGNKLTAGSLFGNKLAAPFQSSKSSKSSKPSTSPTSSTSLTSSTPPTPVTQSAVIEKSEALEVTGRVKTEKEENHLPEKKRTEVLRSISKLIKEFEATKTVETLNI